MLASGERFISSHLYIRCPLCFHIPSTGAEIAKSVVSKVGVELASCSSDLVNGLTTYLNGRYLLNPSDVKELSKQDATGDMLSSRLSLASTEKKGRGEHLIRDLYLSLLDFCQDRDDAWAYSVAFDVRKEGIIIMSNTKCSMLLVFSYLIYVHNYAFISSQLLCSWDYPITFSMHNRLVRK